MTNQFYPILDDLPTSDDALDFKPYVKTLVKVCMTSKTPLTIGIFGSWGSGKTSLMRMIQKELPESYTVVWFDAWKYENEQTLWRAFLLSVLMEIQRKQGHESEDLNRLKTMLYRDIEIDKLGGVTIDLTKLGLTVAKGAVQIGLSFLPPVAQLTKLVEELHKSSAKGLSEDTVDAIRREHTKVYIDQVQSLEQFQDKFSILVKNKVLPGRLVVFVDDLDRCLPTQAVRVLEAIKLFADVSGCVFVLGLDHEIISRGVEKHYREMNKGMPEVQVINGDRYLEKIIQLPFLIPPVEHADMGDFIHKLVNSWPDLACPDVFAEGLQDNPRQIKRTVNVFLMLWQLAQERQKKLKGKIKPIRLAKVVAIQSINPELYKILSRKPGLLRSLEWNSRQKRGEISNDVGVSSQKEASASSQVTREAELLMVKTPEVARLLSMHPADMSDANFLELSNDHLRMYFTLTRRVDAPLISSEEQALEASRWQREMDLAKDVQVAFMPTSIPEIPDWQVAATLRAARIVSGDFYDLISLPTGKLGVVIADVSDKGMPAALYMTLSRTLLRYNASENPEDPAVVLSMVNKQLLDSAEEAMFVTVFYGVLDPQTGKLQYCIAGHPPPYIVPADPANELREMKTRGIVLGVTQDVQWDVGIEELLPGEALVLYTDGINDSINKAQEEFGSERLVAILEEMRGQEAKEIDEVIVGQLEKFIGDQQLLDDITLLVLSRERVSTPSL